MANAPLPQFDPTQLVQQATQALNEQALQMQAMKPVMDAFSNAAKALASDPHTMLQRNLQLYQSQMALGANMLERMMGKNPEAVVSPAKDDKRFGHESWNLAYFDLIKQSYLLTSNYLMESIAQARGLDETSRTKASFYTRQFVEAMSPSNFLATNPEALTTALSSQGQSLVDGFKNLLTDLKRGRISMTDYSKFEVGGNIGVTKGEVVFRNRMVEVIQYSPTKQCYAKPLVICPPWINRFYILDLKQENSLVKYLVDAGYQVFMISWKNPDASYRDTTFEDYITDGLFAAVDAVRDITGEDSVNAVGYCIGGAMLGTALSVMASKNDKRIASATFLTTIMDYQKAGELSLFTDEAQLDALDAKMQKTGFLDGKDMATTFSMLRSTDLIWSFVINNYLMGKQPFPFDILYWNDDSTRMPAAMHSWYLRNLYLNNSLVKPGSLTVLGTPVDLRKIDIPMYMLTGINDHITPWGSCYSPYATMKSKSKRFVLGKAGHVAGVVNPPTPAGKPVKRSYWVGEADTSSPESWLRTATEQQDSWWPDYVQWLSTRSGEKREAPKSAGSKKYPSIGAAPGTYVLER